MPESGLVQYAQVAREVAEAIVLRYRSPYSMHEFTQPSLLALLFLMRYEDLTDCETQVRIREHAELPLALEIARVLNNTTLNRLL
jgi:hypothetical protein